MIDLFLMIIIFSNAPYPVLGTSPSFPLVELPDPRSDMLDADSKAKVPYNSPEQSCSHKPKSYYPDITEITYLSNGKFLNSTIWLDNFRNNSAIFTAYSMSIIIMTEGNLHADYVVTLLKDKTSNYWRQTLYQLSSSGEYLEIQEDKLSHGPQLFSTNTSKAFVNLYLDLSQLAFPGDYIPLFLVVSVDKNCIILDANDRWEFSLGKKVKISSDPIVIRPNENHTIELTIQYPVPKLNYTVLLESTDHIEISQRSYEGQLDSNGSSTLLVDFVTDRDVEPRPYTIPVVLNFSLPSYTSQLINSQPNVLQLGNITQLSAGGLIGSVELSNVKLQVLPGLTFQEIFSNFWGAFGGIITLIGSFILGYLGGRFSRKSKGKSLPKGHKNSRK